MEKEVWGQLTEYHERYWISNYGNLKSIYKSGKEVYLNVNITPFGYKRVQLRFGKNAYKHVFLHVLVAKIFVSNPYSKPFVNHKNSNRMDCYYENLEWCTRSENHLHGFKVGNMTKKGINNPTVKLTEEIVWDVFYSKRPVKELAALYNVGISAIYRIKCKEAWAHLHT